MTTQVYWERLGSAMHSLRSEWSVMKRTWVVSFLLDLVVRYPYVFPTGSSISLLMCSASEMAASFLGWVQTINPFEAYPASYRYWTTCVLFPEPVSATSTHTCLSSISSYDGHRWGGPSRIVYTRE